MEKLNDIRHIIKPLPISNDILLELDNILENLIIHNNVIYNTYVFNHIIYYNNNIKSITIDIVKKHITNNIKHIRTEFRNLNKKNKLDVSHFNTYFDNIYKLLGKINSMFHHIEPIIYDENKKWGYNTIIDYTINSFVRILASDITFQSAILKSIIKCTDIRNFPMEKFIVYIKNFSEYDNNLFEDFVKIFDEICIKTIPVYELNETLEPIMNIYEFKNIYTHYKQMLYKYFYISKSLKLPLMEDKIIKSLQNIISINNNYVNTFLLSYKKDIEYLIKHIDISLLLLSYKPNDINTFISYYITLYEISLDNSVISEIIYECIKTDTSRFFNNSQSINDLVEIINNSIISKNDNCNQIKLYYHIGYNLINKDEFINGISQKLMERIMYTDIDDKIEASHFSILMTEFKYDYKCIYKYKTIYKDYVFTKIFNQNTNYNLIITSTDAWNINYKSGFSYSIYNFGEFSANLCNICYKYYNQNEVNGISKKLNIYSHIGFVDINIGNTNLIVLPAHMFILEQFKTFDDIIEYDLLLSNLKKNMDNYNDDFLQQIINSLVISKVINIINNKVQLNIIIKDINKINLVDIFYNMTNYKETIKKEIEVELALERTDIINANINHFIKINNYTLDELLNIIKSNIKIFNVSKELFDKSIQKMINYDYIQINNNIVQKIYY